MDERARGYRPAPVAGANLIGMEAARLWVKVQPSSTTP
jgi:hypothetical protein